MPTLSVQDTLNSLIQNEEETSFILNWVARIKKEIHVEQVSLLNSLKGPEVITCTYIQPPTSLLLLHKEMIIEQGRPYLDSRDNSLTITHRIILGQIDLVERFVTFNNRTIQLKN